MGRWTQYEEDSYRLPEGITRIGYDADTKRYTFRDREGTLYQGAPGADFGILTPLSSNSATSGAPRPGAFESENTKNRLSLNTNNPPTTFHDILPSNLITSPSSSADSQSPRPHPSPAATADASRSPPRSQFVDSVRKTALPKMQGVVQNLRRSVTSVRRAPARKTNEDTETLLRRNPSNIS